MPFALRRAFVRATFSTAALAVTAAAAAAQAPVNPFGFGVSAGAVVPTGRFADAVNTGFSVDGLVTLRVPTLPVSFRGEVGYSRLGFKESDDVNFRIISGVANVVFGFQAAPTAVVRPYVIAGIGAYNGKITADDDLGDDSDLESETNIGFNGGIGIEIPLSGITGFGEVRYTSVRGDAGNVNFIPIRFGIRF
jgi:opacity protein-like surface antigen